MELGEKLKQARLEAGLSQRQLCGDTITRNMLSQIENGSAKPSFATLQALAARLGKPVSYFREDAPSENLGTLYRASQLPPEQALALLQDYLIGDPILDEGYYLLCCRCQMDLAEQAIADNRLGYARALLQQAELLGEQASAFSKLLGQRLALLQFASGEADTDALSEKLPDNTGEMYLRASSALQNGDPEKCLACLLASDRQTEEGLLLKGDALMVLKAYEKAIDCFSQLEEAPRIYTRLELCYRELGNFEKAYHYACLQR